jgi:AmmeMemoRadiSam system protein A
MTEAAQQRLRQIARASAAAAVAGEPLPEAEESHPELQGEQGCFVTLKSSARLRGCLGNFHSSKPLYQLVNEMARASAIEDPRFLDNQITPQEMPQVEIEISVLSPMQRLADPLDLELGKHGIYIRSGHASGCLLPQVATETGWTKEEYLSNCCRHKAGLAPHAWQDPATEVSIFTAEIIREE